VYLEPRDLEKEIDAENEDKYEMLSHLFDFK